MTNLPKFTELADPKQKAIVHMLDMIRFKSPLKAIKAQASVSGFNEVAKAKTFKSIREALIIELKNSGLIIV